MEEVFKIAFRNLSYRKSRTLLTLMGVMIGIAAVVALISLGDGLNRSIEQQLDQLGPNRIFIAQRGGGGFGPPSGGESLSNDDVDAIKKINDVEAAVPMVQKVLPVRYVDESYVLTIFAFPADDTEEFFSDIQSFELSQGRFMEEGERSVAIIGSGIYEDTFSDKVRLRSEIKIAGKSVRVVGIMKPTGSAENDNVVFMSLEALEDITGEKGDYTFIMAKAREDPGRVAQDIEDELEDLHGEKLFVALTSEQLQEQINSIFGIISIILLGIASISLIVASFGIMNTMLMAVLERTKEIGTMKAIGATNRSVVTLFLAESAIVGFLGGVVGAFVGYAFAASVGSLAINFLGSSLLIEFNPILMALVITFSTIVGIISGTYPAYRAAKLDPIEALRHE